MADIFISYAREDRAIAERLASAIEASGKSVWWDRHIKGGAQFSKDIERELAAASHVLVLWSAASVESRWVRDEATEAADDERLIGATIDGTMPPLGFRQFHTVDLQDWAKTGAALPNELAEAFGAEPTAPTSSAPTLAKPKSKKPLIIAGTAIALALAGGTYVATQGLPGSSAQQSATASLAVLPFDALGKEDIAYLGPGIAGTITNDLARLEGLQLTANSSTNAVAGQGLTAAQIGERLGVSHLIEGQLSDQGDTIRAEVALVDTATGNQIWNDAYNARKDDLQRMTADISRDIAAALQSRLNVGAGRIVSAEDVDPRAFEAYLRAREAQTIRFEAVNRREAYNQYRRAIAIAPDFVDAHAGLAYLLSLSSGSYFDLSDEERVRLFEESLDTALRFDPNHLLARTAKAGFLIDERGDLQGSLDLVNDILADVPDYSPALYHLGRLQLEMAEVSKGIATFEAALARDPFDRNKELGLTLALAANGDYDRFAKYLRDCDGCDYLAFRWMETLGRLGNADDMERDWPTMRGQALRAGVDERVLDLVGAYLSEVTAGKRARFPAPVLQASGSVINPNIEALVAYGGEVEKTLQRIAEATTPTRRSDVTPFALPGRTGLDDAARADPRYHRFFEIDPAARAVIAYRREQGHLEGLPVFPIKPYEGD